MNEVIKKQRKTRPIKFDTRLYVKISSKDKVKLKAIAKNYNMTLNGLIRSLAKGQIMIFSNDKKNKNDKTSEMVSRK